MILYVEVLSRTGDDPHFLQVIFFSVAETLYSLKLYGNVYDTGAYNVPSYYNINNVSAMPYNVSGIGWKQILDKYNCGKYNGIFVSVPACSMHDTIAYGMLLSYNVYILMICDRLRS